MQDAQIKYHYRPPSQPPSHPRTFVNYQPLYPISLVYLSKAYGRFPCQGAGSVVFDSLLSGPTIAIR